MENITHANLIKLGFTQKADPKEIVYYQRKNQTIQVGNNGILHGEPLDIEGLLVELNP